ncbi:MAG: HAD-IC family P-type ATPase [Methanotrichaceae archaeon]|nr:HAD-IC family P-type ATPase [Methanotrichaceae archaeon]
MSHRDDMNWHAEEIQQIFEELKTSSRGLSSGEAERRLQAGGPNELEEEKGIDRSELLIEQVKNPLIAVLFLAALISFLAGKVVDTIVIAAVIGINTALGFYKEYKAEEAIAALRTHASPETRVLRDCPADGPCQESRIKSRELVPGDIILLEAGSRVPADSRVVEAANLEADESMLTGESVPARKKAGTLPEDLAVPEMDNILFAGTVITQGRAKAVVFATGMATQMGNIAGLITRTEKAATPLKKRTLDLSKMLMLLALIASSVTLAAGLRLGFDFIDLALFTLAMAVSAIPEGLPAAITVALAVGVGRMAARRAIIRKLDAVEALGSVTAICTDKTGTLTTNQMTVQKVLLGRGMVEVSGAGFQPEGSFRMEGTELEAAKDPDLSIFLHISALCNDSSLKAGEGSDGERWKVLGDPTEGALVVVAAKSGLDRDRLAQDYPRIDEIPFDSQKKYMATLHRTPEGSAEVYLKGAPEVVLAMCSAIRQNGAKDSLSRQQKEELLTAGSGMAGEALRVLAMAYGKVDESRIEDIKRDGPSDLIFAGFSGMMDPPRPEAMSSVKLCQRAGIRVMMATGDHKTTAEAVAREIGILAEGSKALTGPDLDALDDAALAGVIDEVAVFARVSPEHKYRIVEALRQKGHIVAMTGDGVNDAPALKKAEVGVAMGISGADVTKETADMILADDNFSSIVSAVEEGRVIFENIRKVVKYLLSTNAGEILTILIALLVLMIDTLIFTPVQILWVNLVTDGLLVVNLAMEPKEEDVMDQPPKKPGENIINLDILKNVIFVAVFMAAGTLWVYTREMNSLDLMRAQTLGFTTMAMFQIFNALNCRSRTKSVFSLGLLTNKYLIAAIAVSLVLQLSATVVPFMQTALGTVALSATDWAMIFAVSSTVFIADELRKLALRMRTNRQRT